MTAESFIFSEQPSFPRRASSAQTRNPEVPIEIPGSREDARPGMTVKCGILQIGVVTPRDCG
jgi:hypothetical protein